MIDDELFSLFLSLSLFLGCTIDRRGANQNLNRQLRRVYINKRNLTNLRVGSLNPRWIFVDGAYFLETSYCRYFHSLPFYPYYSYICRIRFRLRLALFSPRNMLISYREARLCYLLFVKRYNARRTRRECGSFVHRKNNEGGKKRDARWKQVNRSEIRSSWIIIRPHGTGQSLVFSSLSVSRTAA